jgi:hypothetical protein
MDDRMPAATGDQPAVHRICGDERERERERQGGPEERVGEPRLHRAGHDEDHSVVDDLHHGDRNGVRRERDSSGGAESEARAQDRHGRERVAEEEGEDDCEHDRRKVPPAERGPDHEAENFPNSAAGQAVGRRREGDPVDGLLLVGVDVGQAANRPQGMATVRA